MSFLTPKRSPNPSTGSHSPISLDLPWDHRPAPDFSLPSLERLNLEATPRVNSNLTRSASLSPRSERNRQASYEATGGQQIPEDGLWSAITTDEPLVRSFSHNATAQHVAPEPVSPRSQENSSIRSGSTGKFSAPPKKRKGFFEKLGAGFAMQSGLYGMGISETDLKPKPFKPAASTSSRSSTPSSTLSNPAFLKPTSRKFSDVGPSIPRTTAPVPLRSVSSSAYLPPSQTDRPFSPAYSESDYRASSAAGLDAASPPRQSHSSFVDTAPSPSSSPRAHNSQFWSSASSVHTSTRSSSLFDAQSVMTTTTGSLSFYGTPMGDLSESSCHTMGGPAMLLAPFPCPRFDLVQHQIYSGTVLRYEPHLGGAIRNKDAWKVRFLTITCLTPTASSTVATVTVHIFRSDRVGEIELDRIRLSSKSVVHVTDELPGNEAYVLKFTGQSTQTPGAPFKAWYLNLERAAELTPWLERLKALVATLRPASPSPVTQPVRPSSALGYNKRIGPSLPPPSMALPPIPSA